MATTWGANAWGDNSWASDQNTIDVNGIPVSFNLGQAQYVPVSGWGRSAWGLESWSVNYQNANISLTGYSIPITLGDETTAGEINEGWSNNTWGEYGWGTAGTVLAQGNSLSTNLNSVSINAEVNIGWGSDTWGYETWGISGLTVDLTGIGLTATLDNLTINADGQTGVLTGEEMTTVVGDALGSATVDADVTGIPLTATLQYQEAIVNPTGQELTANDGTANLDANTIVEISAESAVTWGNSAWGYGVFGNQPVTTLAMSMQEGNVDPAPDVSLTGNVAAMFVGDETVTGDANTGTITNINWGEETWGQSTWGNGTYFDATGYAQAATINLGTAVLDANTIADVSGQLMTMQEGDESTTANANVSLTGNALTMASGSLKTLIWNEVNTGTAPIVPPGWQEVDTAA
jgi:hypothetical protein